MASATARHPTGADIEERDVGIELVRLRQRLAPFSAPATITNKATLPQPSSGLPTKRGSSSAISAVMRPAVASR
jgi:hypothetical protein